MTGSFSQPVPGPGEQLVCSSLAGQLALGNVDCIRSSILPPLTVPALRPTGAIALILRIGVTDVRGPTGIGRGVVWR